MPANLLSLKGRQQQWHGLKSLDYAEDFPRMDMPEGQEKCRKRKMRVRKNLLTLLSLRFIVPAYAVLAEKTALE